MSPKSKLSASAVFALALAACAPEGAAEPDVTDKAAVEQIVRDYILENPEIIEEALITLAQRQEAEEQARVAQALTDNADALYGDPRDFSIGPEDAAVTIVEFFDYRCGFCKASVDWVQSLPEEHDGKVRVVFKEFPILSPESREASLAALAAGKQGKYVEMHQALMKSRSQLKQSDIEEIAESVGVDLAKLEADAKSTSVQKQISDVRALAEATGTRATPTFVIDGQIVSGFDRPTLERLIEAKVSQAG